MERLHHDHRLTITGIGLSRDGRRLGTGEISFDGMPHADGHFWAVHEIDHGLIVTARHYLTDPGVLHDPAEEPVDSVRL